MFILQNLSNIRELFAALSTHKSLMEYLHQSPTFVSQVLANKIGPKIYRLVVVIRHTRTGRKLVQVYDAKYAWHLIQEIHGMHHSGRCMRRSSIDYRSIAPKRDISSAPYSLSKSALTV
jgi:hypothetical protein